MAARRRAATAPEDIPEGVPATLAVVAVRTPSGVVRVACPDATQATNVLSWLAGARAQERLCLLPATAWSDDDPDAEGRILIDVAGIVVTVTSAPAGAVPLHALRAVAEEIAGAPSPDAPPTGARGRERGREGSEAPSPPCSIAVPSFFFLCFLPRFVGLSPDKQPSIYTTAPIIVRRVHGA